LTVDPDGVAALPEALLAPPEDALALALLDEALPLATALPDEELPDDGLDALPLDALPLEPLLLGEPELPHPARTSAATAIAAVTRVRLPALTLIETSRSSVVVSEIGTVFQDLFLP
jgi:hypothetical protein